MKHFYLSILTLVLFVISISPNWAQSEQPSYYLLNMGNSKYLKMEKKATDTASSNNNDGQFGFVSSVDGNTTSWAFTKYSNTSLVRFADSNDDNIVYFGNQGDNNYSYKLTGMAKYNKSGNPEAKADNQSSAGTGSKYNCYLYKISNYLSDGTSFTADLTTTAEAGGYYFIASANVQSSTGMMLMGNTLSSGNQITISGVKISSNPGTSSITVNVSNIKNYIYQFVSSGSQPQPTSKTLYGTLSIAGSNGTIFASTTQSASSGSTSISVNKSVDQSASSASQTIYLHATAYSGYTFQGWSETNGGAVLSGSNVAEYAYTFTFSGNQSSPTAKTLYAVFKQNGSSEQPQGGDGVYYIKNYENGTYFTSTSSKSSLSSTKQEFSIKALTDEYLYQVSFTTGGTTYAIDYEQLIFTPITPTTNATDNLYFYEIADINANTLSATQVKTVSAGKYYFILGTSKSSGNTYILSNEPYNNGSLGAEKVTDGNHSSSISISKTSGTPCIYTLESNGSSPIVPPTPTGGDDEFYISNGSNYVNMPSSNNVQLTGSKQAWTISAGASANTFKMTTSYNSGNYTFYYDYDSQGFSPRNNITEYEDEYTSFYFFDASTGKLATSVAAGNSYYIVVKSKSGKFYMFNNSVSGGFLQRQQLQSSTNDFYISAANEGDITTSTTVNVTSNAANYQFTLESTGSTPQPTPTTKTLYGQLTVVAANGTAFISETSGATSGSTTLSVSEEVEISAESGSKTLYLSATPASGYEFVCWSTDNSGSDVKSTSSNYAYTFEFGGTQALPTEVTLYAIFKQSQSQPTTKTLYGQLTVAATNGTAFISETEGAVSGSTTLSVSEEVEVSAESGSKTLYLSATPAPGYEFVCWSRDNSGTEFESAESNYAYTFLFGGTQSLPTERTLYAIFKQSQSQPTTKTLYGQLTVAATNGTAFISETEGAVSGSTTLSVSEEVEVSAESGSKTLYLSATPAPGYEFVCWSRDNSGTEFESAESNYAYTFLFGGTQSLPTERTLYAIFKQSQPQPDPTTKNLYGRIAVSAANGSAFVTENQGATTGGNVLTVSCEVDKAASVATKTVYLHAKANDGYKFLGWSTSSISTTPLTNSAVAEYAYTFTFDGTEDSPTTINLYAVFEKTATPDPLPEDIDPSTDPSGYDYIMYLDDAEASTGTEVNLALNMKNAENNITGIECEVYLPEGIEWATEYDNFSGEVVLKQPILNGDRIDNRYHNVSVSNIADGVYKILAYSTSNQNILGTDGVLLYLPVSVSEDMEDGYHNIYLKNIIMANTAVQDHSVEQTVSNINISSYTLGDVNNDTEINVTDIVATVSYLMGNNPKPFIFKAADVHVNGEINVTDIVGIIDIINHQSSVNYFAAKRLGSGNPEAESDNALEVVAEGNAVTLNMTNKDEITAFQCDVYLSEDIEWASVLDMDGEISYALPTFAGRTDANHHSISLTRLEDGGFRIIVYSMNNDAFLYNEGAVLNLPLNFNNSGSYSISLENITLTTTDVNSSTSEGKTFFLDNATGMNGIMNAGKAAGKIFDLNGIRSNKAKHGFNIINNKKMWIK